MCYSKDQQILNEFNSVESTQNNKDLPYSIKNFVTLQKPQLRVLF